MDALVIHISNGMKSEVDRALDVLLVLLKHHCKAMLSFISLIKVKPSHAKMEGKGSNSCLLSCLH